MRERRCICSGICRGNGIRIIVEGAFRVPQGAFFSFVFIRIYKGLFRICVFFRFVYIFFVFSGRRSFFIVRFFLITGESRVIIDGLRVRFRRGGLFLSRSLRSGGLRRALLFIIIIGGLRGGLLPRRPFLRSRSFALTVFVAGVGLSSGGVFPAFLRSLEESVPVAAPHPYHDVERGVTALPRLLSAGNIVEIALEHLQLAVAVEAFQAVEPVFEQVDIVVRDRVPLSWIVIR